MRQKTRAKKCLNQRRYIISMIAIIARSTYRSDGSGVTKQHPELENGQGANPANGEQPNPFDAQGSSQA